MGDRFYAKRTAPDRVQEPAKTTFQRKPSPVDPTRLPLWATLAYGNQVPPSLRLPVAQPPQVESAKQESRSPAENYTEERLQRGSQAASQEEETRQEGAELRQHKENTTGLPEMLKVGMGSLSGISLDLSRPNRSLVKDRPAAVWRKIQRSDAFAEAMPHEKNAAAQKIRQAARQGVQTPTSTLPFVERIQQSFGRHDISQIQAHLGPEATESAKLMDASAYATGSHVVFADKPNLYTAAHEAAHIVQQHSRLSLTDGIGKDGDVYERHANEVANQVVSGRSAEGLLDRLMGHQQNMNSERWTSRRASSTQPHDASSVPTPSIVQMMRPHPSEVGRNFQVRLRGDDHTVGQYLGPDEYDDDLHRFRISGGQEIQLDEQDIIGYRPTVGLMHPPGQRRSNEERLAGRSFVTLSAGDLSEPWARLRRNPQLANQMAATTYGPRAYGNYEANERNLLSLGVPIVHDVDMSSEESVRRLAHVAPNAHLHFQMPRVPRGTQGYSTQQLVRDTLSLPETLQRPDVRISMTVPHPSNYETEATHNRIYGILSGRAFEGTDVAGYQSESEDSDLEEYGYGHVQSTVDRSTDAAERRRRYNFF